MSSPTASTSTSPCSSTQPRLMFICENGEELEVPEHLPHFSAFLQDYLSTFMADGVDKEALLAASRIQLQHIQPNHLRVIFDLLGLWKRKQPGEYMDVMLEAGNVKKIRSIPAWSQLFFQMFEKDDLILAANAANFLSLAIFNKYYINFLVARLEGCEGPEEMMAMMNLEEDLDEEQRCVYDKFLEENGTWKQLLVDLSALDEGKKKKEFTQTDGVKNINLTDHTGLFGNGGFNHQS